MNQQLVYRMTELSRIVGLSKTTIYDLIKKGDFPQPVRMTSKSVAWRVKDVTQWVDSLPTSSDLNADSFDAGRAA